MLWMPWRLSIEKPLKWCKSFIDWPPYACSVCRQTITKTTDALAEESMTLLDVQRKGGGRRNDLLQEAVRRIDHALMDEEPSALIGAERAITPGTLAQIRHRRLYRRRLGRCELRLHLLILKDLAPCSAPSVDAATGLLLPS
jgi:hypothetical protein